ncbi:MAG: hypothetical protein ACK452_05975, partial [Bacteroidota bacterium]
MKKIFNIVFLFITVSVFTQNNFNSRMFGVMEARQLGPGTMSGRITAIEGVIKDDGKTLYVGT